MKAILSGLVLSGAIALGAAPAASASPATAIPSRALSHGHGYHSNHHHNGGSVRVGFGTGFGQPGGFYRTQMQWVQQSILVGYDPFGRPVYDLRWVQQPVTVWVPYAPTYSTFGVGVGFRF